MNNSVYRQNVFWMLFERCLRVGVAMVVGLWIIRYLGAKDFGLLSYSQSLISLFLPFTLFGTNQITSRDMVLHPKLATQYLAEALAINAAFSTIAFLGLLIYLTQFEPDQQSRQITLIVGLTIFTQGITLFEVYFQSILKAKPYAIASVATTVTSAAIKIYLVLTSADLIYFAASFVFDTYFFLGLLLLNFKLTGANLGIFRLQLGSIKLLAYRSWPFMVNLLLITIYLRIDQILIKRLLGEHDVGQYAAAVRLSEAWYVFPITVVAALYPAVLQAKLQSEEMYFHRLKNLYSLMFLGGMVVSLFVTATASLQTSLLLGGAYSESAGVLAIHTWASVFAFLGIVSSRWLLTEGLYKIMILNSLFSCVLSVALNWLLIPRYGIIGSAWATVISYAFFGYIGLLFWKSSRRNFSVMTRAIFSLPKISRD